MLRITRIAPFLIFLAFPAAPQVAQGAKACIGPSSPSALNQYCENIPTSTGGTAPGTPGSSNVGSTLPRQVARRIQATSAHAPVRQLLSIPTARHSARVRAEHNSAKVTTNVGAVNTSPGSIGLGLILVLVLSALVLVGLAFERRRRTGSGTGPGTGTGTG
jgi:hypothetical protein